MFHWLKWRGRAPEAKPRKQTSSSARPQEPARTPPVPAEPPRSTPRFADTAPLPEVVSEGNTQADWSAWEDSMMSLDSQLQEVLPNTRIYVRETRPSQLDDIDPFSSVKGKRDR